MLKINNVNPLKLYEYMAAGLPVVSARWEELEQAETPAYLYRNSKEFINIFNNLNYTNVNHLKYINYASKYNWNSKVGILNELFKN